MNPSSKPVSVAKPVVASPPTIAQTMPEGFTSDRLDKVSDLMPTVELDNVGLGAVSAAQPAIAAAKIGSAPKIPATASKQVPAVMTYPMQPPVMPPPPKPQPVVSQVPAAQVVPASKLLETKPTPPPPPPQLPPSSPKPAPAKMPDLSDSDIASEGIADPKEYAKFQAVVRELADIGLPIIKQVVEKVLDNRKEREEKASLRLHLRLWKMLMFALIVFLVVAVSLVWLRRHEVAALLDRDMVQNSHTTNQPVATDNSASSQPQSQPSVPTPSVVTVEVGESKMLPFDVSVPKGIYKIEGRVGGKKIFTFLPDGDGWKGTYLEPLEAQRVEIRYFGKSDASLPNEVYLCILRKE